MICIPIVGASMPKALEQIISAEKIADILELRLDLIDSPDLKVLLNVVSKPVIVTNRTKLDGGQFRGTDDERLQALHDALAAGADLSLIQITAPTRPY